VDGRTIEIEGPGCDVWTRLEGWVTEEELAAALAREYGTAPSTVSPDVRSLLHELHSRGFVDRDG